MRINQTLVGPRVLAALSNRKVDSETVYAFEVGVRARPLSRLLFDAAAFYNKYNQLMSFTHGSIRNDLAPPGPVVPLNQGNDTEAKTAGLELLAEWEVFSAWKLGAGYTFLWMDFTNTKADVRPIDSADRSPKHQLFLRSHWNPIDAIEFDMLGFYVSRLGLARLNDVDSYFRLDLRVAWHPWSWLELALVGQNLLETHHAEWSSGASTIASEPQREIYGKATFRF